MGGFSPLPLPSWARPQVTFLARSGCLGSGPRSTGARKAYLVRSTPPRPAPPEVRCLTPEVPVRRGWGVLLTRAAAAVAGIERARGAGLLVSGPNSGPDWGWGGRRLGPCPLGSLRSTRPPVFRRQYSACQMAGDLRRRRGHRSRGRAPPASFATCSVHRCATVRRPDWFSIPPLHLGGRPFLRFSEWTLLGKRGGDARVPY